jgi:hypothetical protein
MRIIPLIQQLRELVMSPFAYSVFSEPGKVGEIYRKTLGDSYLASLHIDPSREGELLRILLGFRNLEATDPRDHIYAGLSMLYPYDKIGFFPLGHLKLEDEVDGIWRADYEKKAAQLFAGATQFVCSILGDLKFLNLVEPEIEEKDDPTNFTPFQEILKPTVIDIANIRAINERDLRVRTSPNQRLETDDATFLRRIDGFKRVVVPQLPTWSPNWAQGRLSFPVPGDHEMNRGYPYQALGSLKMSSTFVQDKSGFIMELKMKAAHLGTVSITGDDLYGGDVSSNFEKSFSLMAKAERLCTPAGQMPTEALMRTLVGDRNADGTQFTSEDAADTINYLRRLTQFTLRRKFIIVNGLIGFGPRATNVGDDVYIIPGCHVPIVIREKTLYVMKSNCSLHSNTRGCMQPGCDTRPVRHDVDHWYQVIGGGCKYLLSPRSSNNERNLK